MATTRDIVSRALRRIRVLGAGETADADDAAIALDLLNSMMLRWASQGVEIYHTALALGDTFKFFVPPAAATSELLALLDYRGTWDASANSPALASSTGTTGYFYKVATAGSATLDDVTSWAVGDYAVFDGAEWLKTIDSARFDQAVVDILALELSPDFGKEPHAALVASARAGWRQIQAAFIKAPLATLDRSLMETMQRPYDMELNGD